MKIANCAYCGQPFSYKKKRLCCDRRCSAKLAQQKRGLKPWPPEAEHYLYMQAGRQPFKRLVQGYKSAAGHNGWPNRSSEAIRAKMFEMKLSRRCTEDGMGMHELARQLSIPPDRVRVWAKNGLPYSKISRNQVSIKMADLKQWLLEHPQMGGGIDQHRLACLIGNEVAELVANTPPSRRGHQRPVICLGTGQTYPGLKAAARELYVSRIALGYAIRRGTYAAGHRWAYVDQLKATSTDRTQPQ